jgi:hypothetical protein
MNLGALLDRLTILSRKIVELDLVGETTTAANLREEARELADHLLQSNQDLLRTVQLGALNGALWERENQLRVLREEGSSDLNLREAGILAFQLAKLNDWRAAAIGEKKLHR